MRSKGDGLGEVERQFLAWRRRRQGRRIPAELWDAAVALVAEHSSSEICRVLRLNQARFKEAREARIGVGQRNGRRRVVRPEAERRAANGQPGLPLSAFVEMPAVTASAGAMQLGAVSRLAAHGCRLSVETPQGVLSVELPAIDHDLVALVRRCVMAAVGEGSAA